MKKTGLLLSCLIFAVRLLYAQTQPVIPESFPEDKPDNKGKAVLLHFSMGVHLSGGDFSDRFGTHQSVGMGLDYLTPNNWQFGLTGQYQFGQQVKEDPLARLRTPEGDIIGNDQQLATVVLRQRGAFLGGQVGKIFPLKISSRSGIKTQLGLGWWRHKIRVQDDTQSVPQFSGEYLYGYDRLTGGWSLQEFIGWQRISQNRRANWYAGFEFLQGSTQSLRSWDFAEKRFLNEKRIDLAFGFRVGWILPFYPRKADTIYY